MECLQKIICMQFLAVVWEHKPQTHLSETIMQSMLS